MLFLTSIINDLTIRNHGAAVVLATHHIMKRSLAAAVRALLLLRAKINYAATHNTVC